MPYIHNERRIPLLLGGAVATTAGELNYQLTVRIVDYLAKHGLSYQTCNDIVGALDNAKDEFKRRIQNPYEDQKIKENGDVY